MIVLLMPEFWWKLNDAKLMLQFCVRCGFFGGGREKSMRKRSEEKVAPVVGAIFCLHSIYFILSVAE